MKDIYEKFAYDYDEFGNIEDYLGSEKTFFKQLFWENDVQTVLDKTTPRLIQFHTLKNAVNPPFLGGFSIFNTVVA